MSRWACDYNDKTACGNISKFFCYPFIPEIKVSSDINLLIDPSLLSDIKDLLYSSTCRMIHR